jgi:hypothetical protein
MTVLMQQISISKTSGNKTKKKRTSIKYDGKKAHIMCSNNGKKTFKTLTNNQLMSLMAMPASKKTLNQRLGSVLKKRRARGTKKLKKKRRETKKRKRKKKKNKNKGKKH